MTLVCAGGTSRLKAGVAESVIFNTNMIELIAGETGEFWIIPFVAALGVLSYDVLNMCTSDPPGFPTLTGADLLAVWNVTDPVAQQTALGKIKDWVTTLVWYQFCECTVGGAPVMPAAPQPPTNLPAIQQPGAAPCRQTVQLPNGWDGHGGVVLMTETAFDPGGIPPDLNYVALTCNSHVKIAPGWTIRLELHQEDASLATIGLRTVTIAPGASGTVSIAHVPTAAHYMAEIVEISGSGETDTITQMLAYCGSDTPTGATSICCPPDPTTMGMLSQILGMLTLIQRQHVPFAYVTGSSHGALTGSGQFDVSGILGLVVSLVAIPGRAGLSLGNPDAHFEIGYVTMGTGDGWHQSIPIRYDGQIVYPVSPFDTVVAYHFTPGVVVQIDELIREP